MGVWISDQTAGGPEPVAEVGQSFGPASGEVSVALAPDRWRLSPVPGYGRDRGCQEDWKVDVFSGPALPPRLRGRAGRLGEEDGRG